MAEYLGKRKLLVPAEIKQLFITYGYPHRPATNVTVSRWIQNGLKKAGIDIQICKAHSCRAAAASKAMQIGISREEIMKRGCWCSESTCKKFYDKDIVAFPSPHSYLFLFTVIHLYHLFSSHSNSCHYVIHTFLCTIIVWA